MVLIEKIEISNYKNIGHTALILTSFNVIVGANNSGKSNFVQVLSFLDFVINGAIANVEEGFESGFFAEPFKQILPGIAIQEQQQKLVQCFSIQLKNTKTKEVYVYSLELNWKFHAPGIFKGAISSEILTKKDSSKTGKAPVLFQRNTQKVTFGEEIKEAIATKEFDKVSPHHSVFRMLKIFSNAFSFSKIFDLVFKAPILYLSNIEINRRENRLDIFDGRIISTDLNKEIQELEDSPKYTILKEVLKDILGITDLKGAWIENNASGSKNEKKDKIYYFNHLGARKFLSNLSDGSLNIIAIVVKILNLKQDIILIEEPENSLHPKALQLLIQFILNYENEKQFIITTHSIALLNMVKYTDVVVAKCNNQGISDLQRISDQKELVQQLKKGYVDFSDVIFFGHNTSDIEFKQYGE